MRRRKYCFLCISYSKEEYLKFVTTKQYPFFRYIYITFRFRIFQINRPVLYD